MNERELEINEFIGIIDRFCRAMEVGLAAKDGEVVAVDVETGRCYSIKSNLEVQRSE